MDDETANEEQQATSSKKESLRLNPDDHGSHDDKRKYENRQKYDERGTDAVSNSVSFTSSYSARSRLEVAEVRQRGTKAQKKKRSKRIVGKAEKRSRSAARRRLIRKAPKRKPRVRKEREPSVSTIFTRLTSGSGSQGCNFCGHRCCRRRYMYETRRRIKRRKVQARKVNRRKCAKCIQAGSRTCMLSPLYINTNKTPEQQETNTVSYCEITPEMIFESIKKLTMWRQYAATSAIFQYIKLNFPVNCDDQALLLELMEKLNIAAIVEIITKVDDGWCLNCHLQDRYITKNHVTKFWQIYTDTLKPVQRKLVPINSQTMDNTTTQAIAGNPLRYLINNNDFI